MDISLLLLLFPTQIWALIMSVEDFDVFGIRKIYPDSNEDSEKWEIGPDPGNDPRFFSDSQISKNQDGSWKLVSNWFHTVELKIRTSAGYDLSQIIEDNGKALKQGYIFTPKDWKNTETTIEMKINNVNFGFSSTWIYGPSGRNSRDPAQQMHCLGDAYFGRLFTNGIFTMMGKQPNSISSFYTKSKRHPDIESLLHRWVRLKLIMYNINNDTGKRIELYVDDDLDNNFKLVDSVIDTGGWSKGATNCGSLRDDQPIVWGGPQIGILCGGMNEIVIRNVSVREIAVSVSPDPSVIAPPLDTTVPHSLADSAAFLYTGPNAIQTGVDDPSVIDPKRIAIIRGKVIDRNGNTLPGVKITILDHPEFGETLSRADGIFDLVVNGGGVLAVNYEKAGFLPAQRHVNCLWQDYAWSADVALIAPDSNVTAVDLTAASIPIHVVQGSKGTDSQISRQPTLLIPAGTTADIVLPDGSKQTINNMKIRCTEYTVGPNGPKSMPAELPPTSGYTYAVDLTTDEAIENGLQVSFNGGNKPIFHYVENFLNFPVGTSVPAGYYDKQKSTWIPSENGRVIKILSINNNLANLDIDGDGAAESGSLLTYLGITDVERQQLASLYQPGETLWRIPIRHFSTVDCNWPIGPPPGAGAPGGDGPGGGAGGRRKKKSEDNPCGDVGSIIECQRQVLVQHVNVVGTPFKLIYRSDRVPGRSDPYTIHIPLSGPSLPGPVIRIDLQIHIAGNVIYNSFGPEPDQTHIFTWDGKDAYGRTIQGVQSAIVKVGYVYEAQYKSPANGNQSFGNISSSGGITGDRARNEIIIWSKWDILMGGWDSRTAQGLGGWNLDIHHSYDPASSTLYLGNGSTRNVSPLGPVITSITSMGAGSTAEGISAINADVSATGLAVAPDGTLYLSEHNQFRSRIRKIRPDDGVILTVAGTGPPGYNGDNGYSTQIQLNSPFGIAIAPDGSLYIADFANFRIRKWRPDNIIRTVGGNGSQTTSGDEGDALLAGIKNPTSVAVGPDGSCYITTDNRIRKISPDGFIHTVAGTGVSGESGDNGPATSAQLKDPCGVAVGTDGSIYIAEYIVHNATTPDHRIRRVGPDGMITTVAGGGNNSDSDGEVAVNARLSGRMRGVAAGDDGTFFILQGQSNNSGRIRRVGPDGMITTVAGGGQQYKKGALATTVFIEEPRACTMAPDGSLFIVRSSTGTGGGPILKVSIPSPSVLGGNLLVPSEDGSELYIFSERFRKTFANSRCPYRISTI